MPAVQAYVDHKAIAERAVKRMTWFQLPARSEMVRRGRYRITLDVPDTWEEATARIVLASHIRHVGYERPIIWATEGDEK